jgi:hypothetical protein
VGVSSPMKERNVLNRDCTVQSLAVTTRIERQERCTTPPLIMNRHIDHVTTEDNICHTPDGNPAKTPHARSALAIASTAGAISTQMEACRRGNFIASIASTSGK